MNHQCWHDHLFLFSNTLYRKAWLLLILAYSHLSFKSQYRSIAQTLVIELSVSFSQLILQNNKALWELLAIICNVNIYAIITFAHLLTLQLYRCHIATFCCSLHLNNYTTTLTSAALILCALLKRQLHMQSCNNIHE